MKKVLIEEEYLECESCKCTYLNDKNFGHCTKCKKEICENCGVKIFETLEICKDCFKNPLKTENLNNLNFKDVDVLIQSLEHFVKIPDSLSYEGSSDKLAIVENLHEKLVKIRMILGK